MKALALLTAAALSLLSVAASAQTGPYYGKGKAPPPPVVTQRLVRAIGGTGHCAGPFSFWAKMSAFICKAYIRFRIPLSKSGRTSFSR